MALVTSNVKGQNQEITGETTLTKEDKDTGHETQGKLSLKELNTPCLLLRMEKRSNGPRTLNQNC